MSGCDHASCGSYNVKCLVVTMLRASLTISCTVKCLVVTMLRVGLTCLKPHSTYNLNLQHINCQMGKKFETARN